MAGVRFLKKIVPIALAGAAALVMAIPMGASAGDWNHHDQTAHRVWPARHRNWFGGWHHFHAAAPANVSRVRLRAASGDSGTAPPCRHTRPHAAGVFGTGYG